MARRRPTAPKASKKTNRSRRFQCEPLEPRTYFVVLHGGDVFEFWADNTHFERVVVTGNTTVELIASHISNQTGQFPGAAMPLSTMDGVITSGPDAGTVGAGLPPQALPGGSGGGGGGTQVAFIDDIYAMYVSAADANSAIAVAGVPDLTQANRPMQPYTGSVTLLVRPTTGGNNISVAVGGSGTALLGARAVPPQGANSQNFPTNEPIFGAQRLVDILGNPLATQTIPSNITTLGAGLIVAPGNNLGQFLWGGTIIGTVNIHGSVGLFYAGWIVTGNAFGEFLIGSTSFPRNFNIDGDVHELLTNGSLGSNTDSGLPDLGSPTYLSGVNIHIGGKAGMIKSLDSVVAGIDITHSPTAPNLDGIPMQQLDVRGPNGFDPWDSATFGGDPAMADDSFTGAQFLGPIDANGDIQIDGQIQGLSTSINKSVDYYAVPLLAGQTVSAKLAFNASIFGIVTSISGAMALGVFDSEQRLIATDYSIVDPLATNGQAFRFTAKLPGIYYFAVTGFQNTAFAANFQSPLLGTLPYILQIQGVGDLAVGGIAATNNILDNAGPITTGPQRVGGFHVANGDLGAAFAGNLILSDSEGALGGISNRFITASVYTFVVDNGNLRAVQAGSLGNGTAPSGTNTAGGQTTITGFAYQEWPTGTVPNGSVGMLRATSTANGSGQGATGVLIWNDDGLGAGPTLTPAQAAPFAVGGDYQMVDAANLMNGDFIANGNVGTIRANAWDSTAPGYVQVNAASNPNKHGTIDLIDVQVQLGLLSAGGPAIVTGPGGNCRYIHVGPNATVFRDRFFGGGQPEATLYQPGETAHITDDSGSGVTITPQNATDSLLVTTYPVRGSGGAAIVKVEVENVTTPGTARGASIATTGGGSAEIGSIQLDGTGTAVTPGAAGGTGGGTGGNPPTRTGFPAPGTPGGPPIVGPGSSGNKFTLPTLPTPPTITPTTPMDLTFTGSATLDVYEINGITAANGNLVAGRGQITSITDNTPGSEIANLHLNSLGTLTTVGSVGALLKHGTPAQVLGNYYVHKAEDGASGAPFTYPLFEISSLVRVLGNVVSISASGGVGNVYTGIISNVAGADAVPTPNAPALPVPAGSALQGAAGAVGAISGPIVGAVVTAGTIGSVTANGIGWAGSGAADAVGIYSTAFMGPVTVNGDDHGAIVSTVGQTGLTVRNGSLAQAVVTDFTRFDFAEPRTPVLRSPTSATPITQPQLDLGSITVTGNGGIIGTFIAGEHLGPVTVGSSGFGVFDTLLLVLGDGTMLGLTAGGYGIRDSAFSGGASVGALTARGNGSSLPVTNFPTSVRNSETGATFDPVTGQTLSFLDDISLYLTTTATTPQVVGATESGVIENVTVAGSRDLGSVNAWSVRGRTVGSINSALLGGIAGTTTINIANSLGQVNVIGPVNGFNIVTGRTTRFRFGGDVANFSMTVAGPIGNLVFNSSLLGSSVISALGPSGKIQSITIHGNFSGQISATRNIGRVTIFGSMVGSIKAATLGILRLTGGMGSGSLAITGNVGTIQTTGDLGAPGNTLAINGTLGNLIVGGNLNTNVTVGNNLKQLLVAGSILSAANVKVANTITLLKVGGDVQAGATIMAHLIKKKVIGGQLLGTITTA